MERLIIDRFENGFAVCEDEAMNMRNVPRTELPAGVKEGDTLVKTGDEYVFDRNATNERQAKIRSLEDKVFGKRE